MGASAPYGGIFVKILLVIDQFDDGNNGTTISAQRFAQVLRRHGHQVRVLSTGAEGPDKYVVPSLYIPLFQPIIRNQGMTLARPVEATLREAIAWADVVHFMMPFLLAWKGLAIAEALGVPHTAAFHIQPENITYNIGLGRFQKPNDWIYRLFRVFYGRFGHIHCPSQFIADELIRNGYRARLHIVSNGVDPQFVYRKEPKSPALAHRRVIVMIGRLSREKRQDILIHAAAQSRHAESLLLVLAGRGPKQRAYEKLARRLGVSLHTAFYEGPELLHLLAQADLYVHASDAEIEAISCIEAFASGLVPVISDSEKSATHQFALVDESRFARGDAGDLARKIDYWLDHEQERREMEKRYAQYGQTFAIDHCVSQVEEMFHLALREAASRPSPVKPTVKAR